MGGSAFLQKSLAKADCELRQKGETTLSPVPLNASNQAADCELRAKRLAEAQEVAVPLNASNQADLSRASHVNSELLRFSFTLAEVLIVLGIIGLIADMTIPTLVNDMNDKQLRVMWKKTYSDMNNAARLMSIDEPDMETELDIAEAFGHYLKNLNYCDTKKAIEQGCWTINTPIYFKNKTKAADSPGDIWGGASCMNIVNGALVCFDTGGTNTNFYFDVNGPKLPNTVGKDIFAAVFNKKLYAVKPAKGYKTGWGAADGDFVQVETGDGTCDGDVYGWGCSTERLLD